MRDLLLRIWVEEHGWGRIWTGLAMAIALAGGGLVYQQVTQDQPVAGAANLWVDTNGGTCTRQSPAGSYVDAQACSTIASAISAATSGDTIEMQDGYYGCETITSSSKTLTIRSDGSGTTGGNVPWVTCTSTQGGQYISSGISLKLDTVSNLTLNNIYVAGVELIDSSHDITFTNVHVTCNNDAAHFQLYSGDCNAGLFSDDADDLSNFTMVGGEIGPTVDNDVGSYPGASHFSGDNSLFNGVLFHDNINLPGGHSECLFLRGGDGITFRNNSFINCTVFAVFITCLPLTGGNSAPCLYSNPPDNITFENNFVGPGQEFYAIQVRDTNPALTMTLRYNTFYKPIDFGTASGTAKGNIMAYNASCAGGYTFTYNVFGDDAGGKCSGTGNVSVTSTAFTSSGAGYNTTTGVLNAGSVAIGAGDQADYPATDYEGQTRPQGASVDAGWDDR